MIIKKILLILILLDVCLIGIGISTKYKYNNKEYVLTYRYETLENDAFYKFTKDNNSTIKFLANTFQIEENVLIQYIKEDKLINYSENIDKQILDLLLKLEKNNKELFDSTIIPCQDSKKYMVALIKYWTTLYPNVDFATAASIAQIESGYRASHLLKKNNIFGGKNKDGIISYKNIEYGTLKFVKLLNDGYYNKGLDTVEKIGVKYNPTWDEFGNKIAVPEWVRDVTSTLKIYKNYDLVVDTSYLLNNKNNNEFIDNSYLF